MQLSTVESPPSDPFAAVAAAVDDLSTREAAGGMTLAQLENILSDIRHQPKWRQQADICADYYAGNQITSERLERMNKLGIPPLVTNLIRPTIDTVLGIEAKARSDWRVIEETDAAPVPEVLMKALNGKLNEAERESRADRAISDAYAGQIKTGLHWVEVSRAVDALDYPYRVQDVSRDEIHWDWRAKRADLSDARWLTRKRRFDLDELTAMMPEHADLIDQAVTAGFRTWQWDTKDQYSPDLAYAAEVERVTNMDENEWRDAERKRATLYEVWYRMWKRGDVLDLPNGMVIPFDENDPKQAAAVMGGMVRPRKAVFSTIRVAFYLGPHRLYDVPTPYKHRWFPYVPFWGFREDKSGVPFGLIRGMISPQDVVNSADARMHWMLNARRLIAHSNAVDTRLNSWRQVQDELARPDSVVLLDPNSPNALFKVEQDFELTAQQYQRRQQAAADIENAGGVFKSMMGKDSGQSGIAINALVEQGSITLAEINDNYRFARRQVGDMLFSLVREDMAGIETQVAVQPKGMRQKEIIVLNQRMPDGSVANNTTSANIKVVLEDVPSTPAFRAQQLQVLSEVVKSLPEAMQMLTVDVLIGLTDVPEKQLLVERLRKAANIQDLPPEQEEAAMQQQQQIQAEALRLQAEAAMANIEESKAKAMKTAAEADKIRVETEAAMMAMQAPQDNGTGEIVQQLQMQLQDVVKQAGDAQERMYEEMVAAKQAAEQQRQALEQQIVALKQNTDIKTYEIDQKNSTERMKIDAEHQARLMEIEANKAAAQTAAQDGYAAEAGQLSKQIEEIRKQIESLAKPEKMEREEREPPVVNVTVPVTIERSSGAGKTVSLTPNKDGGYTAAVSEAKH
jgi:hypothetical protein